MWTSSQLKGHQAAVFSASFSPDSSHIVTASWDNAARVWRLEKDGTWHSVALQGHQQPVTSAAFSLDGSRIVTASRDKTARVWSRVEGDTWTSAVLAGHTEEVTSASFFPDGAHIVTTSRREARFWSQDDRGNWSSVILKGYSSFGAFVPPDAVVSPDGARIVTASGDDEVQLWGQGEGGDWTSVTLGRHLGRVTSVAFSPDGTRIVTASTDGIARVWDIRWLMGPGDWAKAEPLSLPKTVCREKLHGSWTTVKDPKTGRNDKRIAERLLTVEDIKAAPILTGREGEDVCAPFLEKRPWWSRLVFWR